LNNYQSFSDQVYGEVRSEFIHYLLTKISISKDANFVDLGCGIGNVVCQMAAITNCNAHGIEIMETPYIYSVLLSNEFKARLRANGLQYGNITLKHGSFVGNSLVSSWMKSADVIFVNNFVFSEATNESVKQLFLDCEDGTIVISLRNLSHIREGSGRSSKAARMRYTNNVANIFECKQEFYPPNSVSWASSSGKFYIHVIDRN
ncbi:histone methylation DOT1, partial [Rozella allomycis CSF55]